MNYQELVKQDFEKYRKLGFLLVNNNNYNKLVLELFKKNYFINFLSTKAELKRKFSTDFYKISHSCLIESFLLFSQNYIRASSLVLRSAIENYLKHQLQINNAAINDRKYLKNKQTLDKIINNKLYMGNEKCSLIKINERLLTIYKKLSGLSHSLTLESKNLQIDFILDFKNPKEESIKNLHSYFCLALDSIILLNIHSTKEILSHWNKEDLENFFSIVMGNKRIKRLIRIIKHNEDLSFH